MLFSKIKPINYALWIVITSCIWTVIIIGSLIWSYNNERKLSIELASNVANAHFERDTAFKRWGASHGGVYVPIDAARTLPNPHLSHLPERDITTPSGQKLTLMNPAYMLAQITSESHDYSVEKGGLTTFPEKLINPTNTPDQWELAALNLFASGADIVEEITDINGIPYFRLMKPLFMEENCINCHSSQNYKVGDLSGGIGVTVSMTPYIEAQEKSLLFLYISYGFFWVAGLIALAYLFRQTKAREFDQTQAEERVLKLALFDELTGLPNRRLMQDRLEQTKLISTRSDKYCALLFIDLDNFKSLNDTFGHEMGDILLRDVACRLNTCVRADDTVARMGGDEFVVLLKELSLNKENAAIQAEAIGAKVLITLNESFHLNNVTYNITPSIGATLFEGQHASYSKLLKQADLAMYKAKKTGRNKLCFYDPEMEDVVQKRAALEKDLHEAIKKKQFVLHYQIQVDYENHPKGAEILVRWQHPEYGLMLPAEFITLAEETEQIVVLGYWIIEAACIQLVTWALKKEMSNLTISVNVSVKQFKQHDFVDRVLAIIKQTGANPLQLKMELTESLLISNKEETIEKMILLKAAGIGFSLDDFGTGFSSLSYLKRLPLDWLKIDRSFVQDILKHENDAAIIKTIISLAHNLGLEVIAEGVETTMQKEFLIKAGCFDYQGYLFGHPLSLEHFEEYIAQPELVD